MFAFDWDLRDINKRHPPGKYQINEKIHIAYLFRADREVTATVLWFYINILYFPYNAHELAKVPFDEWAAPIFEHLQRDE